MAATRASLQIPSQPESPPAPSPIINPKRGADEAAQTQAPRPPRPPGACSAPGPDRPCWNLDLKVTVLLVTVAGALILLLLYRLLRLRHRLRTVRGRPSLQYYHFYHAAAYTLNPPGEPPAPPCKNGVLPKDPAPLRTTAPPPKPTYPDPPPPPSPAPSPPPPPLLPLPPPPVLLRTPPTPPPPFLLRPAPSPEACGAPPSPHLSWGAGSDTADVYSRIGAFRPARLSALSGGSAQVILFEHSSL